jgi:rubrerythrin
MATEGISEEKIRQIAQSVMAEAKKLEERREKSKEEKTYSCPSCGKRIKENAGECPHCGESLEWEEIE